MPAGEQKAGLAASPEPPAIYGYDRLDYSHDRRSPAKRGSNNARSVPISKPAVAGWIMRQVIHRADDAEAEQPRRPREFNRLHNRGSLLKIYTFGRRAVF
jgi:hypothetical protein